MADKCEKCQTQGLPILPVRYAVVPKDVSIKLPNWAGARRVKDVDLGADYHYALRTLRGGYLYIFYDKNQYGANQWDCYTVTDDGRLVKQPSPAMAQPPTPKVQCADKARHNDTNVQMLVIERPDLCGKAWIAFSEHKWSNDTLARYQKDATLRDARMQTIKVPALSTTGKHSHGTEATQQAIESVIEYAPGFNTAQLPDATGTITRPLSKEDGTYNAADLTKQSTRYPWALRTNEAAKTAEAMKTRAKRSDGSYNVPTVLALWDAVGIAHELNGFRNEAAGRIEQYGRERELQLTAMNAIDGLAVALAERAGDAQKKFQDEVKQHSSYASQLADIQQDRARAEKLSEPDRSKALQICDIREGWARRDVPSTLAFGIRLGQANLAPEPLRSKEIAAIQKDVDAFLKEREKNYHKNIADARKNAWPKYEKKLKPGALGRFRENYNALLAVLEPVIDARTEALIAWLEAPLFIDTLEDCHPQNIADGVEFEDKVGEAIFGISSSKNGESKIKSWVAEMSAQAPTNLLWRAFALNQRDVRDDITSALAVAAATKAPIGQLSVEFLTAHVRKWADMYKKANTMQNTVAKAANAAEGIKPVRVTGLDRIFLTVGDKLFFPTLQRGLDTGAEFAVRALMLARAGVEPQRILDAIKTQAKEEGLARAAIVRRLQAAGAFIGAGDDFKDARHAALKKTWADLKASETRGPQALKENRLSLVVGVLELVNLAKIAWEFKDNKRTLGELAAASCSATAAMLDIAANAAKHLVGDKVSVTFQVLKVGGGVLSAGAGYYASTIEWAKAEKFTERERYALGAAYGLKAVTQFGGATLGLLASVSYAAPLMQVSGTQTARWIGGRLLFYRLFCMTWAVRLNLVGLAITFLVWVFVDDALQDWCQECPFGESAAKGPQDPKKLMEALGNALAEIT